MYMYMNMMEERCVDEAADDDMFWRTTNAGLTIQSHMGKIGDY